MGASCLLVYHRGNVRKMCEQRGGPESLASDPRAQLGAAEVEPRLRDGDYVYIYIYI